MAKRSSIPAALAASIALGHSGEARCQPATLAPYIQVDPVGSGAVGTGDPLLDPNPFLLSANQTRTLPLRLTARGIQGAVNVVPMCCWPGDPVTAPQPSLLTVSVAPRPLHFETPFASTSGVGDRDRRVLGGVADGPAGESRITADAALTVSTSSLRAADSGTQRVRLRGLPAAGGEAEVIGEVAVSVVGPTGVDTENAGCAQLFAPPGQRPEVLFVAPGLAQLFVAKMAAPERTSLTLAIGFRASSQPRGVMLTLERPGAQAPLRRDESLIAAQNRSASAKSLYAVHSGRCAAGAAGNMVLAAGADGELRISAATATTLVLSELNENFGVFAEENFWTLFGGRRVTLLFLGD